MIGNGHKEEVGCIDAVQGGSIRERANNRMGEVVGKGVSASLQGHRIGNGTKEKVWCCCCCSCNSCSQGKVKCTAAVDVVVHGHAGEQTMGNQGEKERKVSGVGGETPV